jgi:hypothetical protein
VSAGKRPLAVLVICCLFIVVGGAGLVRHFPHAAVFHQDDFWIEPTELLALTAGVFMLIGHNWARWLAVVWLAFHVALSWPVVSRMAVHTLFLAAFTWLLFRPDARQFFTRSAAAIDGAA